MKALQIIRRVFVRGCALTALITLFMFLIASVGSDLNGITLTQYLLIFAFSMLISLSGEIYALRFIHILLRILVQYAALLVSFLVLFIKTGKIAANANSVLIYILLFTLIYAVVCGILFPVLRAVGYYQKNLSYLPRTEKPKEEQTYTNRYS